MRPVAAPRDRALRYERRRPEETILFQVLQTHWRTFLAEVDARADGVFLPRFVVSEFEAFLRCGILAHGFVRVRCDDCGDSRLVAFSCKRRGFCGSCLGRRMCDLAAHLVDRVIPEVPVRQWVLTVPQGLRYRMAYDPALTGTILGLFVRAVSWWLRRRARRQGLRGVLKTGAVTVIQRFDSALALNVHFHSLVIDGVYALDRRGRPEFHPVAAPTDQDVAAVAERVFRAVHRLCASLDGDHDGLSSSQPLLATLSEASIRRVVAYGPRRGCPLRRLGRAQQPELRIMGRRCADVEGFNVHANVRVAANDRDALESLCRYVGRPPLSEDRLGQLPDGNLTLRLKRPWSDGTTHIVFSPGEFIEKLVPLVPRPRAHVTRYHGVLAPASGWREQIVPGSDERARAGEASPDERELPRRRTPWAELLKRVFLVDVLVCPRCAGPMKVLAAVTRPDVVSAILNHLGLAAHPPPITEAVSPRAGPSDLDDPASDAVPSFEF